MSLAFADGGRQLVSLGYEQSVRVWDTEKWKAERVLPVPGGTARGLALSPDERTAALSLEGKVQLWSVDQWSLEAELPVSVKAVYGTTFSPDGRWLAAGAADGKIRVWDLGGWPGLTATDSDHLPVEYSIEAVRAGKGMAIGWTRRDRAVGDRRPGLYSCAPLS
jgi:WD40 repeat protein